MGIAELEVWQPLTIPDDPDAELAEAARASPAAFKALYERYVTIVYRYCLARLRNPAAAEDATSDVFLKAWRNIRSRREGGRFAAWLMVITRNTVADAARRSRPTSPLEAALELVDGASGPEELATALSDRQRLMAAMAQLTEEQRSVLELQLAGWRGPEIAEALGRTHASVKMTRFRALQRLRELLSEQGGDVR